MNLRESIEVAIEGLVANKMRAALTMLGVIIGVGAVIAMLAIAQGAKEQTMQRIQQMGTNVLIVMSGQSRQGAVMGGFGSVQSLTLDDANVIATKCPSIVKAVPEVRQNLQVKYQNQNTNTTIFGTSPDYPSVRNYTVQEGRFFSEQEMKGSRKVAVIGPTTAMNLFGEVSPVGKAINIKGSRFKVVGLMAPKGATGGFGDPDDQIFVPVTTAMRRMFGVQYLRSISVQTKSMELMGQATEEVSTLLRKRHRISDDIDDFIIRNQAEFMEMAAETSRVFTLLLAGIASVSLLVGGIGIMNIMLVSVTERTREIGIRKALGARRHDILMQFLIESLVLSLFGGIAGILFGLAGSAIVGKLTGWSISVSVQSMLLSFSFAAIIGIFFGLYPARQASNLNPIDALRYE
ncbi:MAG: ABC transporter permease [Armatimonadota bacterium]|nr:ABC transporter permease [Armatimonadota bacterium]